jgi:hypothetical protein
MLLPDKEIIPGFKDLRIRGRLSGTTHQVRRKLPNLGSGGSQLAEPCASCANRHRQEIRQL